MIKQKNKVCIYVFDINDGMSTAERLRIAASRYCKDYGILSEQAQTRTEELFQVARAERGKPYFPACPQIQFSVSHSGAYVVCAFAGIPVGVDLQEHTRLSGETEEEAAVRFRKMAHRFFHPLEAKFVEEDSYRHFFRIWAARESYVKYIGQGIDASFSEHCVIPEADEAWPRGDDGREDVRWQASGVFFCEKPFREAYTLCVCAGEECECEINVG